MDSNQVHNQQVPERRSPGWGNRKPPSRQLPRASGPEMKPQTPRLGNPFMPRILGNIAKQSCPFFTENTV